MKRKFLSILLCAVITLSLLGCEKKTSEESFNDDDYHTSYAGVAVTTEETKIGEDSDSAITVMASDDWIEEAEMELGKKFEEETGIHVNYHILPADQYQDLLLTRLNSGDVPDIWCAQSGFALKTTYNVENNAVDLSDEPWMSSYSKFSAEQTGIDGKNYGLTYYDTTTDYYMVYNKKLFKAAGAEVPTTFNELLDTCKKLKNSGVNPIYEPMADGWHLLMLLTSAGIIMEKNNPGIIDKLNSNKTTFAQCNDMKLALDQLNELYTKGYFGDNAINDNFGDAESLLASGEYAACMLKPGAIKTIVNSPLNTEGYTEDDFGLFLLPLIDNQFLNIHPTGPSRFIYSGSSKVEESKQYLAFLLKKENVQFLIDEAADVENIPVEVGQTPEYSQTTLDFLGSYDDPHSGMVLQDVILYFNEQWMDINADLAEMLTGNITSDDVLKEIDIRRTQLAEAAADENWE